MLRKRGPMIWKSMFLSTFLLSILTLVGCGNGEPVAEDETLNTAERIWAQIIPVKGTVTNYEIPLSLENTQQFIDWYDDIDLTVAQRAVRDGALEPLVAPCCDEYPISTWLLRVQSISQYMGPVSVSHYGEGIHGGSASGGHPTVGSLHPTRLLRGKCTGGRRREPAGVRAVHAELLLHGPL